MRWRRRKRWRGRWWWRRWWRSRKWWRRKRMEKEGEEQSADEKLLRLRESDKYIAI